MAADIYAVDDIVILKSVLTRSDASNSVCRIVGLLPAADRGERQYRVRFDNENFERRIVASDIDASATTTSAAKADSAPARSGEPWFKPSRIRVGK